MAHNLQQVESEPVVSRDPAYVWQRIEAYIDHRWDARDVVWRVEGPGHWAPPLSPATITATERWTGTGWEGVTPSPSPLDGFDLAGGVFRFTATVGDNSEPPAAVLEAFRRLTEYMAAKPGKPGARSERVTAGSVALAHSRSPAWMAEAMRNSGAADLLKPWRRPR